MGERDIVERTFEFSLRIVRLCKELEKDRVARILMNQVLRSGTTVGANVEEVQGRTAVPCGPKQGGFHCEDVHCAQRGP